MYLRTGHVEDWMDWLNEWGLSSLHLILLDNITREEGRRREFEVAGKDRTL